jgi:uncharacterized protein (TIGR02145 family)
MRKVIVFLFALLFIYSCTPREIPVIPTVTSGEVTNITSTTATCAGNVTADGGAALIARGVCWSTTENPTITNSKTSNGTGLGTYTSNITDLSQNTTYYVRAYATNSVGTAYGKQKSFTTQGMPTVVTGELTNITATTATCAGNVTADGGSSVTARGVCWNKTENPTIDNSKTTNGTGLGIYNSDITDLSPNTTYYVRAYATNAKGTAYGEQKVFSSNQEMPTVVTGEVANITTTTATCSGNVTSDGGSLVTARGVCWSKTENPTIDNSKTTNGTGLGTYNSDITDLSPNTTYYVRAYAKNSVGTAYGEQKTFTTNQEMPTVVTGEVTNITATTATCDGDVTADGSAEIIARGVCWSTTENPTIDNFKTSNGTGTGTFSSNLTVLCPNTTYYVRAYATSSVGTAYGERKSFTTLFAEIEYGSFTDSRDGNQYETVTIGQQVWMAENLAYLPSVCPPSSESYSSPYNYVYGYNSANVAEAKATSNYQTYGALYNWPAALTACPPGWHLPSDAEWTTLTTYLGGENVTGGKMKETGTTHWESPNTGATNASGFAALPSGCLTTSFYDIGYGGYFWSYSAYDTRSAWYRSIINNNTTVARDRDNMSVGYSVRCVQGHTLPIVNTGGANNISVTTANYSGNVISDGGSAVTARGVCWSTTEYPTTSNSLTADGTGLGTYTSNITGLSPNTTYYVKAYATNSVGTAYGVQKSFRTYNSTYTDSRDGHVYKTITIGTQVWMAENLAYLPEVSPRSLGSSSEPYYYVYGYESKNVSAAKTTTNYNTYGVLYNWSAAMNGASSSNTNPSGVQGICPEGWHLPSDAEWTILTDYLGGEDIAGSKMKEVGTTRWESPNTGATNESGFTALPGGFRTSNGEVNGIGTHSSWWSSTEDDRENNEGLACYQSLYNNYNNLSKSHAPKEHGFSVRCVRD